MTEKIYKIEVFDNEELANTGMGILIGNARLPQSISQRITTIYTHQTLAKCWFFREPCESIDAANGGTEANTTAIDGFIANGDCIEESKTMQELIDEGYLPNPQLPE